MGCNQGEFPDIGWCWTCPSGAVRDVAHIESNRACVVPARTEVRNATLIGRVACGRLDFFWEFGLNPWDMAAGALLVREAGGIVTDMHGGPLNLRGQHVLADNTLLHAEVLELFAEIFAGKQRVPIPVLPQKL